VHGYDGEAASDGIPEEDGMSSETFDPDQPAEEQDMTDPEEYGSLSVEDDPEGTIDPAEIAGTADESDEDVS
jgi:hypothetical protein